MKTPDWAWASHQPLLQAVMGLMNPSYVLEIGTGLYSTPLFQKEGTEYLGIEQDLNWIEQVQARNANARIKHHNLKGLTIEKRHWELDSKQKYDIAKFYTDLRENVQEKQGFKVLFVDCYTCSRMLAINALWDLFDVVIYHDSQPRVSKIYGYDKLKVDKSYNNFQLVSRMAWTGMFVKADIGFLTLKNAVAPHILDFNARWAINARMNLMNVLG